MTRATRPGPLAAIKIAIRAELKAGGWSQKDLARHMGLSEKHVSDVLTGKVKGDPETLLRMTAAVGLSLDAQRSPAMTSIDGPDRRSFAEHASLDAIRAEMDQAYAAERGAQARIKWLTELLISRAADRLQAGDRP